MWRDRALKIVLVLVGLLFSAAIYPLIGSLRDPAGSDPGDTMMMSLYFTLGIFLLIAVRNPAAHCSLIAFAAWSPSASRAASWPDANGACSRSAVMTRARNPPRVAR